MKHFRLYELCEHQFNKPKVECSLIFAMLMLFLVLTARRNFLMYSLRTTNIKSMIWKIFCWFRGSTPKDYRSVQDSERDTPTVNTYIKYINTKTEYCKNLLNDYNTRILFYKWLILLRNYCSFNRHAMYIYLIYTHIMYIYIHYTYIIDKLWEYTGK